MMKLNSVLQFGARIVVRDPKLAEHQKKEKFERILKRLEPNVPIRIQQLPSDPAQAVILTAGNVDDSISEHQIKEWNRHSFLTVDQVADFVSDDRINLRGRDLYQKKHPTPSMQDVIQSHQIPPNVGQVIGDNSSTTKHYYYEDSLTVNGEEVIFKDKYTVRDDPSPSSSHFSPFSFSFTSSNSEEETPPGNKFVIHQSGNSGSDADFPPGFTQGIGGKRIPPDVKTTPASTKWSIENGNIIWQWSNGTLSELIKSGRFMFQGDTDRIYTLEPVAKLPRRQLVHQFESDSKWGIQKDNLIIFSLTDKDRKMLMDGKIKAEHLRYKETEFPLNPSGTYFKIGHHVLRLTYEDAPSSSSEGKGITFNF